jgi:hypothetical protein
MEQVTLNRDIRHQTQYLKGAKIALFKPGHVNPFQFVILDTFRRLYVIFQAGKCDNACYKAENKQDESIS